jgi:hypothetical protein
MDNRGIYQLSASREPLSSRAAGLLLPQDLHVQVYVRHEVPGAELLRPFLFLGVYGFLGPCILGYLTFISIIT